jgi:hypothetical protein
MYPAHNYYWTCSCGANPISDHADERTGVPLGQAPTCPNCGKPMQGSPMKLDGPFPEDPKPLY